MAPRSASYLWLCGRPARLYTTEARRIGIEDLSKSPNEVETAKPAAVSGPIVTVTRGARERILYEFTPTGRREMQGTGPVRSAGERIDLSLQREVSRQSSVDPSDGTVRRRRYEEWRQGCSVAGKKCTELEK